MNPHNIPEKAYYTIEEATELLSIKAEDLFAAAEAGNIEICFRYKSYDIPQSYESLLDSLHNKNHQTPRSYYCYYYDKIQETEFPLTTEKLKEHFEMPPEAIDICLHNYSRDEEIHLSKDKQEKWYLSFKRFSGFLSLSPSLIKENKLGQYYFDNDINEASFRFEMTGAYTPRNVGYAVEVTDIDLGLEDVVTEIDTDLDLEDAVAETGTDTDLKEQVENESDGEKSNIKAPISYKLEFPETPYYQSGLQKLLQQFCKNFLSFQRRAKSTWTANKGSAAKIFNRNPREREFTRIYKKHQIEFMDSTTSLYRFFHKELFRHYLQSINKLEAVYSTTIKEQVEVTAVEAQKLSEEAKEVQRLTNLLQNTERAAQDLHIEELQIFIPINEKVNLKNNLFILQEELNGLRLIPWEYVARYYAKEEQAEFKKNNNGKTLSLKELAKHVWTKLDGVIPHKATSIERLALQHLDDKTWKPKSLGKQIRIPIPKGMSYPKAFLNFLLHNQN